MDKIVKVGRKLKLCEVDTQGWSHLPTKTLNRYNVYTRDLYAEAHRVLDSFRWDAKLYTTNCLRIKTKATTRQSFNFKERHRRIAHYCARVVEYLSHIASAAVKRPSTLALSSTANALRSIFSGSGVGDHRCRRNHIGRCHRMSSLYHLCLPVPRQHLVGKGFLASHRIPTVPAMTTIQSSPPRCLASIVITSGPTHLVPAAIAFECQVR
mmetsp:Transcript_31723/g.58465  ORF Transcript_31723/g.58465 Transcript_31723/m.58465 type:complete len:210 (+) Transcript_31723:423-1052(+)